MNKEQKLKKGCGKKFKYLYGHEEIFVACGEILKHPTELVLCPECKAQLKGLQEGRAEMKKEILEIIDKLPDGYEINKKELKQKIKERK